MNLGNYRGDLFSQKADYGGNSVAYASRHAAPGKASSGGDPSTSRKSPRKSLRNRLMSHAWEEPAVHAPPSPGAAARAAARAAATAAATEAAVLKAVAGLEATTDEVANAAAFEALRLSSTATLVEIAHNANLRAEIATPSAVQVSGGGGVFGVRLGS